MYSLIQIEFEAVHRLPSTNVFEASKDVSLDLCLRGVRRGKTEGHWQSIDARNYERKSQGREIWYEE